MDVKAKRKLSSLVIYSLKDGAFTSVKRAVGSRIGMWQGRHLSIEDIRKSYLFCLVCQMVSVWNSGQSLSNSKRRLRSCKRPCLFIEYYRSLWFRHQISRGTQNLGCFPRADKSIVCLSFLQTEIQKGRFVSTMSISSRNGHGWYKPSNCSKQEIEMRQEIAPFGQNRHGTVQLFSKTRSYPAIAKVIIVWMWIKSFFLPWIRNHYFEATRRQAESVQSIHYKAVEQRGWICRLDQVKWNSGKGPESTEFQVLRRL